MQQHHLTDELSANKQLASSTKDRSNDGLDF